MIWINWKWQISEAILEILISIQFYQLSAVGDPKEKDMALHP